MKKKNKANGRFESLGIDRVQEWVQKCNSDMEYVGGFSDYDSPIMIRCRKCGDVFERSMVTVRHGHRLCCLKCKENAKQLEHERHLIEIQENKIKRHEDAVRRHEEARALYLKQREHPCPVCGTITTRTKYCSNTCSARAASSTHEATRRIRIRARLVDKDITLEKLYERDGGVCWICGMMCDWTDIVWNEKTAVAGNLFPSIDHVEALSIGGEHSWKNIRLAHRICNTMRFYDPHGGERK